MHVANIAVIQVTSAAPCPILPLCGLCNFQSTQAAQPYHLHYSGADLRRNSGLTEESSWTSLFEPPGSRSLAMLSWQFHLARMGATAACCSDVSGGSCALLHLALLQLLLLALVTGRRLSLVLAHALYNSCAAWSHSQRCSPKQLSHLSDAR